MPDSAHSIKVNRIFFYASQDLARYSLLASSSVKAGFGRKRTKGNIFHSKGDPIARSDRSTGRVERG